jgi:hypothetical protein
MTINLEFLIPLIPLISAVVGVITLYQAVNTYKENQIAKRKDIIFPLIDEFDNSEDLFLAKAILDDFTCNIPPFKSTNEFLLKFWNMSTEDFQYYNKYNLKNFLRVHWDPKVERITDTRERAIRRSFDVMIYFFFKLQYLYSIGILKENELYYFRFYFNLLINHTNDSVIKYINDYGLQLDMEFVNLVLDINNKNFKKHRTLLTKIKNYRITGKNVSKV